MAMKNMRAEHRTRQGKSDDRHEFKGKKEEYQIGRKCWRWWWAGDRWREVVREVLLQRLSSGAHWSSAVELDDMLERKRETQMDQHYLCSAAPLNPLSLDRASASLINLYRVAGWRSLRQWLSSKQQSRVSFQLLENNKYNLTSLHMYLQNK